MPTIPVTHFSDILCVWAYVSQIRVDELIEHFGDQVELDIRFCEVFGDTVSKLERQWAERGGAAGYGAHVRKVAADFEHVTVNPEIWERNAPVSSMPCHLFLSAVRLLSKDGGKTPSGHRSLAWEASWRLRRAFFEDAIDISLRNEQMRLAEELGLPVSELEGHLDSGRAHAVLSGDLALARENAVRVSPTIILNEGRQVLTGNVGYRVIEANVTEILQRPQQQQSWC